MSKVVAIVQARMGSTRLAGKVFADIEGKPLIWHVVNQAKSCADVDEVVLAIPTANKDNVLEEWAKDNGVTYFRGDENDVLARYYRAAESVGADVVVRVTADDPCKDPEVIGAVIQLLQVTGLDFAYNNKPPSYPEGMDVEVMTYAALKRAFDESTDPYEREHVTQYLYRHPELFKQENLTYKDDLSWLRLTVDEEADLQMARSVYRELYNEGMAFGLREILSLLQKDPSIFQINQTIKRSAMYTTINPKDQHGTTN